MGVLTDLGVVGGNKSGGSSGDSKSGGALASWLQKRRDKAKGSDSNRMDKSPVPSYKRGGKVRKTGLARLHKGEQVIPAKEARKKKRGKSRSSGKRR